MSTGIKSSFSINATIVSNEFIDRYMAAANGEYVKVYLYVLRHQGEPVSASRIADDLENTESDVKRALSYWKNAGVLVMEDSEEEAVSRVPAVKSQLSEPYPEEYGREQSAAVSEDPDPSSPDSLTADGIKRMQKLSRDEEFSTLLYAAQQYLGKMFTSIECERFAYFYDELKMSGELLEFLAEYCAQNGHTNIRYMEKVALNWYQQGIHTKAEAKEYTANYSDGMRAVMKTFGISRNLGQPEIDLIRKWFDTYGFNVDVVEEACRRTLMRVHEPKFSYADSILADWKKKGVHGLKDIEMLDQQHQQSKPQKDKNQTKDWDKSRKSSAPNRFKNFEERNYNYDDAIWKDIRRRYQKGGTDDGTN